MLTRWHLYPGRYTPLAACLQGLEIDGDWLTDPTDLRNKAE